MSSSNFSLNNLNSVPDLAEATQVVDPSGEHQVQFSVFSFLPQAQVSFERAIQSSDGTGVFINNHLWGSSVFSSHTHGCSEFCSACFPSNLSVYENYDVNIVQHTIDQMMFDAYEVCYCDGYLLECPLHRTDYESDEDSISVYSESDDDEMPILIQHQPRQYQRFPVSYSEAVSTQCCICMSFGVNLVKLSCNHIFHQTCIERWFSINDSCPFCRGVPQMFASFRSAYNTARETVERVATIQDRVEETIQAVQTYADSVNMATEGFELMMHLVDFINHDNTTVSNVLRVWNVFHMILSLGKMLSKQFVRYFTDLDSEASAFLPEHLLGQQQVDFGMLFTSSMAIVNLLPSNVRTAFDFMSRHSRTRFLSDFNLLTDGFYYILATPRIALNYMSDNLPVNMPFRRTALHLLGNLRMGLDIVYAHLPGSIEHRMTERATEVIRQFLKSNAVIRSQAFLTEFHQVREFFDELHLLTSTHAQMPPNLKFIFESLNTIQRIVDASEITRRIEPLWFYIYGPTGRGKSVFMMNILNSLVNMSSYIHQRKPQQKEFFDGYTNEDLFFEDDITEREQLHKYLSFVSCVPQPLEVCAADMKGLKKFTSKAIFTTSNYRPQEIFTSQTMKETSSALERRAILVDFSEVTFDGVSYLSANGTPKVTAYSTNPEGITDVVFTFDPNNIAEFCDHMFDLYDAKQAVVHQRRTYAPITRTFGRPQFFRQVARNAINRMKAVVQNATWGINEITNFLQLFVYGTPQVLTNDNVCTICSDTPQSVILDACQHRFCGVCIQRWLANSTTCPLCRTQVTSVTGLGNVDRGLIGTIQDFRIRVSSTTNNFLHALNAGYANFRANHGFISSLLEGVAITVLITLVFIPIQLLMEYSMMKARPALGIVPNAIQQERQIAQQTRQKVREASQIPRVHVELAGDSQVIYPERESVPFPTELERVRTNMLFARFVFPNNDTTAGIITFVDALSFVCPAHFFISAGVIIDKITVYAEDQEGAQLISGQQFVLKYINVAADVCLYTFQVSNQPRVFKNISSVFSGDLNSHELFLITPDQVLPVDYPTRLQYDMSYFYYVDPVTAPKGSITYSHQAAGLCGALLVTREGKIVGMHVAKEKQTSKGVSRLFSRAVRLELLKCSEVGKERILSPVSAFVLQSNLYRHVPSESSIVPSDLYGVFPVERQPAKLIGKNADGENILSKAVVKNIKPVKVCDENAMAYVEYALDRFLGSKMSKELTDLEVIHGNGLVPRIDPTSSGGVPYNVKNSVLIDYENSTFRSDVLENIQKLYDEHVNNQFDETSVVFGDTLKDELRDNEKILKPRLFAAGPLHFTVLLKRFFSDLIYSMSQDRLNNGIMIGINALGREWDAFARKMQSKSDHIIPGDFENWDGGMLARFQELLNLALSKRSSDPSFCLFLLTHLVRTTRVVLEEMIVTTHSVPSGHALTAFYNSVINFLYQCYAYYILCPYKGQTFSQIYDQQMKDIYSGKYGDDVLMNVSVSASKFFSSFTFADVMDSIGVGFTDENKQKHKTPFTTLGNCTFLKRSFVYHNALKRIVGPLSLKTLCSSISFVSDIYRMESLVDEKVCNFQREIFLHEFLYEPLISVLIKKYTEVYGFSPPLLPIEDVQRIFEREEAKVVYGLAGQAQMHRWCPSSVSNDTAVRAGVLLCVVDHLGREQYLLVKGADYVQENGSIIRGKWGLPKGCVKENERIAHAAIRELFEETSIKVTPWDLSHQVVFGSNYVFRVTLTMDQFCQTKLKARDGEVVSFMLVRSLSEVSTNMFTRQFAQAQQ